MNSRKRGGSKRLTQAQKRILEDYIEKNPNASWTQFNKESSVRVSDAYYYTLRRKMFGSSVKNGSGRRSPTPLYLTVWQYPTEHLDTHARTMLQNLVESLNGAKRVRWQLVELKDPPVFELRERSGR